MSTSYTFGAGSDPFSLAGVSGKLEKFTLVSSSPLTDRLDHAIVKDNMGENITGSENTFNRRREITAEYEATDIGAVGGGAISIGAATALAITRIEITTTQNRHARVRVSAHAHGDGTPVHQVNARTVTLPAFDGFGATDFAQTTMGATEIQNGNWTFSSGHVDREGYKGDYLVGRSQNAEITMTVTGVSDVLPASTTGSPTNLVIDEIAPEFHQDNFRTYRANSHAYLGAPA